MSLGENKLKYKYTVIGQLQAFIDVAGGYKSQQDCLNMTLEEFFDQLPQNGVGIEFGFDSKFREKMQEGVI
ncbi:MAG: hypothetical protein J7L82_02030 [Staphylothermus sp.]|nr:hypothetical protein [Staphylothermus sp.]